MARRTAKKSTAKESTESPPFIPHAVTISPGDLIIDLRCNIRKSMNLEALYAQELAQASRGIENPIRVARVPVSSLASLYSIGQPVIYGRERIEPGGNLVQNFLESRDSEVLAPGDFGYVLLAGFHRALANCGTGRPYPAICELEGTIDDLTEVAIVTVGLRDQESPRPLAEGERFRAYRTLFDSGRTGREISALIGVSETTVSKHSSILRLPDEFKVLYDPEIVPGMSFNMLYVMSRADDPWSVLASRAPAIQEQYGFPRTAPTSQNPEPEQLALIVTDGPADRDDSGDRDVDRDDDSGDRDDDQDDGAFQGPTQERQPAPERQPARKGKRGSFEERMHRVCSTAVWKRSNHAEMIREVVIAVLNQDIDGLIKLLGQDVVQPKKLREVKAILNG